MQDPLFTWPGPFPYDLLAKFNITPNSTIQEINDAGFDMIAAGTLEEQDAWSELRLLKRRLLVDFFRYQIEDNQWPDLLDTEDTKE
jgi:hypothetical protein